MKRFFTAGMTDTGLIRSVNQDAYAVDPDERFFIVADGMGGHAGGQEASRIAIETMQAFLMQQWETDIDSETLLKQAVLEANQAILKDQRMNPERADMGTTAVAVIFRDEQPLYTHIGDSRLYRLRGAKLEQITEDHTWVARAMRLGELTPDQARVHPMRHVLAQCLGRPDLDSVEIRSLSVQSGDRLLLCSDGLTEELTDQIIATHLKGIRACEKAATALINAAKDHGGRDNITVVIVAIP
ncbi:Stp1/IreP family PP2C-type Ser/Thr phosphatase [Leptolyngbya sp. AN03gr2]|uniref:Stp1/IreP family PP2C-type Ser/Thr phosphatase n=1 Tax=unclassified Leptolyngbya TaxID=2650499 RepID=UPI003D31C180